MTNRMVLMLLFAWALLVAPLAAEAQQAGRVPRIGVLVAGSPSSTSTRIDAFRQGLRDLGYVEGQNMVLEYRYGDGQRDRLLGLAAELVRLKVDVVVVGGGSQARAARQATSTVPIVMANVTDPLARGFVASLARPGGNMTGLTALAPELGKKRLQLLKEIVPRLSRVAVVGVQEIQGFDPELKELEVAARALALQLHPVELRGPQDLDNAFSAMRRERAGALVGLLDPAIEFLRGQIAELAVKHRLPAVAVEREHVEVGWLMSYGPDYRDMWRRAATFVDKILEGAKPADLPVEQPIKFELVINLKTAKAIGLTIPPSVLARADEIVQ